MTTDNRTQAGRAEHDGALADVWKIVAEREISTRLREKSFKISVAVMTAAIVGSNVFFSILGGKPTTYDVGVADSSVAAVVQAASQNVDSLQGGSRAASKTYATVGAAEQAVRDGDVDAALI